MKKIILLTALCSALTANAAHNKIDIHTYNYNCQVIGVLDGDTIDCLTAEYNKKRIRLANIDAPEKSQAFGQKAKQRLANYVFGKTIIVSESKTDRYGRSIAEIFDTADQSYSINYKMVQDGLAWAYDRYVTDIAYIKAQQQAQSERKGLWIDNNPIKPEEFRHN